MHKQGYRIIMIGHAGHPEVEGTVGQVDSEINVIEKPAQVWDLEVENPEKSPTLVRQRFPTMMPRS